MKAATAVAEILKREGVEFLIGYPVNPIIEAAAEADIRTIIVRQERTGLHMADAVSRVTSGAARSASSRCSTAPAPRTPSAASPRPTPTRCRSSSCRAATRAASSTSPPNFNAFLNYQHITKSVRAGHRCRRRVPDAMRRAFTQVRNGRPRPVAGRDPDRRPARGGARAARLPAGAARCARAPDPRRRRRGRGRAGRRRAAGDLRRPGRALRRGVGRSCGSWPSCSRRRSRPACRARAPSRRTTRSRSAPAAARCRKPVHHFLERGRRHLRHRLQLRHDGLRRGDADGQDDHPRHARPGRPQQGRRRSTTRWSATPALTLEALLAEVQRPARRQAARPGRRRRRARSPRVKREWLAQWMPKLTSDETPLSPYRVIWDLLHTVDVAQHDHHPRRRQPARPALAVLGGTRRR